MPLTNLQKKNINKFLTQIKNLKIQIDNIIDSNSDLVSYDILDEIQTEESYLPDKSYHDLQDIRDILLDNQRELDNLLLLDNFDEKIITNISEEIKQMSNMFNASRKEVEQHRLHIIQKSLQKNKALAKQVDLIINLNTVFQFSSGNSNPVEELDLPDKFEVLYELKNILIGNREELENLQSSDSLDIEAAEKISLIIQDLSSKFVQTELEINKYKEIQKTIESLLVRMVNISKNIPQGIKNDKELTSIISNGNTVQEILKNEQKNLWENNQANEVIKQLTSDVNLFEQRVKDYNLPVTQKIKNNQQQQEYKKEPDKHNAMLFKSVMNAVAGEHTKYEIEAEASKFAINKSRKKTMKLVESHAKIIANDKNLKSSDKVTLLIGLLEANRKAVSHNEANKSIFAKIGSKGKAKGSRLVSKYDNVLKIAKAQANKQGFKFEEESNPEAIRSYEKFAKEVAKKDIDGRVNTLTELGF